MTSLKLFPVNNTTPSYTEIMDTRVLSDYECPLVTTTLTRQGIYVTNLPGGRCDMTREERDRRYENMYRSGSSRSLSVMTPHMDVNVVLYFDNVRKSFELGFAHQQFVLIENYMRLMSNCLVNFERTKELSLIRDYLPFSTILVTDNDYIEDRREGDIIVMRTVTRNYKLTDYIERLVNKGGIRKQVLPRLVNDRQFLGLSGVLAAILEVFARQYMLQLPVQIVSGIVPAIRYENFSIGTDVENRKKMMFLFYELNYRIGQDEILEVRNGRGGLFIMEPIITDF
jgi:hypothetical protein